MSGHDLFERPVWKGEAVGQPIPPSQHAVSVSLPRWQDVVGYEEKKPEVVDHLTSGYPRFVVHALVQDLARELGGGEPCLPFPSVRVAEQAAQFVRSTAAVEAKVVENCGIAGVIAAGPGHTALRSFWQH